MNGDTFLEIIGMLISIEKDDSVPKGIRVRIKGAINSLNNKELSHRESWRE